MTAFIFSLLQQLLSKQRPVEKENWIRVENTHEPIIDRQLWDKVQKLLTKKHRDIDLETNKNIFAGFIKCGDCGRAMMKNFWRRADGSKSYSFYCGTYKRTAYNRVIILNCYNREMQKNKIFCPL